MKVLTINTNDSMGGAARAAYNNFRGLKNIGVESKMFVARKTTNDFDVIASENKFRKFISLIAPHVDGLPNKYHKSENENLHSPAWFSSTSKKNIEEMNPDLIHIHWVQGGFLSVKLISELSKPIVWTLHDMWPFSGAEHYVNGTERYISGYHKNNKPEKDMGFDLNKWVWNRKKKLFRKLKNLTLVAPSAWMARCAKDSYIFKDQRVEIIPVGLNHNLYCPRNKNMVREILKISKEKKIILIGALDFHKDKRKGGHFLKESFKSLKKINSKNDIEIYILGTSEPKEKIDFGFKTNYYGSNRDDLSLALLYSAVDLFVAPSIEENFAATVFESLSCGIPAVAFDIGGMPDMIDHKNNGYLAKPFDVNDLAQGINWVLFDSNYNKLSKNARDFILRECTLEIQAKRYKSIYDSMIK